MRILVTGGAGFIGSEFIRRALKRDVVTRLVNVDKLTYSGNLENLQEVETDPRYRFECGDICHMSTMIRLFAEERPEVVVHFAAESHVDRSILSPHAFIRTNLHGTFTLLEAARTYPVERLIHVSTDEVYGSIDEPLEADELFPLKPSGPYSASKAGSDLLALSYCATYKVPIIVTRGSNTYGPYQFPEKLIPLMICNAIADQPLPIYGDGMQIRDWLYVSDHCDAIEAVIHRGRIGEIYNIAGNYRLPNRKVVTRLLETVGKPRELMRTVDDRPGHDRRYAMRSDKIERDTLWSPHTSFEDGLLTTIQWYNDNPEWIKHVRSGDYESYYKRQYAHRFRDDADQ
jgi:dTDP-glucose 4,6-dehydratase